jgi:hypothetical protein
MTQIAAAPLPEPGVVWLVYELLDAHTDTIELRLEAAGDLAWSAHLDYLRALQRRGRALLAQALSSGPGW